MLNQIIQHNTALCSHYSEKNWPEKALEKAQKGRGTLKDLGTIAPQFTKENAPNLWQLVLANEPEAACAR